MCYHVLVHILNMSGDLLSALTEEYRRRILKPLQANPHACQVPDHRRAHHQPRARNYCLQALIQKGLALKSELEEFQREAARAPSCDVHERR